MGAAQSAGTQAAVTRVDTRVAMRGGSSPFHNHLDALSNCHGAFCQEYQRPLDQPLAWKGCGSSREWGAPLAADEKKRKEFERNGLKRDLSP